MRRALRNALMSLVLALGLLGAAEGVLRVLDIPDPGIYAGDVRGIWRLRPDLPPTIVPFRERGTSFTVRTNAAGYRGGPPPAGGVLCLGDSTTFGWGVEEDEAWPAVLARRAGKPAINGGVPGYSTFQGRATLPDALALRPATVVLGYLVRDAELAPVSDADRPPPPWDPQLLKLLRELRPPPAPRAILPRVPPDAYRQNLLAMIAAIRASGALPVLLAFPMVAPARSHLDALASVADDTGVRLIQLDLPRESFFAEDPIHLTTAGHEALAERVAEALAAGG